jgi:hypothetical protein
MKQAKKNKKKKEKSMKNLYSEKKLTKKQKDDVIKITNILMMIAGVNFALHLIKKSVQ